MVVCVWLGSEWNALWVACGRYNYDGNNVDNDDKDNVEDDED